MYTNCDVLTAGKKLELLNLVEAEKPQVIALTEIKPKQGMALSPEILTVAGYDEVFHNLDNPGRGIAVLCRKGIKATLNKGVEYSNFSEVILINIELEKSRLILGTIYRSPNSAEDNVLALTRLIDCLCLKEREFILVGDFNFPSINWMDECATGVRRLDRIFQRAVVDNLLAQHVD